MTGVPMGQSRQYLDLGSSSRYQQISAAGFDWTRRVDGFIRGYRRVSQVMHETTTLFRVAELPLLVTQVSVCVRMGLLVADRLCNLFICTGGCSTRVARTTGAFLGRRAARRRSSGTRAQ